MRLMAGPRPQRFGLVISCQGRTGGVLKGLQGVLCVMLARGVVKWGEMSDGLFVVLARLEVDRRPVGNPPILANFEELNRVLSMGMLF